MISLQTFLATEDIGDSLETVEALITKHENFDKSLAAQEEKFKALDEMATGMIKSGNYAAQEVHARREEVRLWVPWPEVLKLTSKQKKTSLDCCCLLFVVLQSSSACVLLLTNPLKWRQPG